MKRTLLALAVLLVTVTAGPISAQQPPIGIYNQPVNPYVQPPVSPYLNMLQRSANPAINYYGLVVPQVQTQRYIQQQEIQALQNPTGTTGVTTGGISIATGHPTRFMAYNQYFLTQGGGTGAAMGGNQQGTGVPPLGTGLGGLGGYGGLGGLGGLGGFGLGGLGGFGLGGLGGFGPGFIR